jgi:NitT/TauT family transport system ATP-binding protein
MTDKPECAVEVSDVTKVFNVGKPNEVAALEHIDLSISDGAFVSLIGPSGCGKSTLLRLIAALTHPTEGSVCVNDKTADQARLDRDYGMHSRRQRCSSGAPSQRTSNSRSS